jgi:hypothetical protein
MTREKSKTAPLKKKTFLKHTQNWCFFFFYLSGGEEKGRGWYDLAED